MDLETENRIAAILMKEAAELRRQSQSEGALAYLRQQPTARFRPNSRFLTATVRGVQQANRVVEVNEMWRLREKQLELDNRLRRSRNESTTLKSCDESCESHRTRSRSRSSSCNELETSRNVSPSSNKRCINDHEPVDDVGLKDDEVDEFLQSRTKRGRGEVGSRMDETGPYLPSCPNSETSVSESTYENKARVLLGPEKPKYLKPRLPSESSSDDEETYTDKKRKVRSSSKRHSKKHKSKEKSREKKKRK